MGRTVTGTDFLATGSTYAIGGNAMSGYGWAKNIATNGRLFDWGNNFLVTRNSAGNAWQVNRSMSGTTGAWTVADATSGVTNSAWNWVGFTLDSSSTSNDAVIYVNGVPYTVTEISTPTGSGLTANAGTMIVSNNATSSGNRAGGGPVAYIGIHNVILTAGEMMEAYLRGFTRRGALAHWPLWGDSSAERDYSGTARHLTSITGTSVVANPPIGASLIPHMSLHNGLLTGPIAAAAAETSHNPLLLLGVG